MEVCGLNQKVLLPLKLIMFKKKQLNLKKPKVLPCTISSAKDP